MDDKLNILLISPDYPNDPKGTGIGTYSQLMANNLAELGHHVHLLSRAGLNRNIEEKENISFHFVDIPRPDVPLNPSLWTSIKLALKSIRSEYKYRKEIAKTMHKILDSEDIDLIESADAFAEILFFKQKNYAHIPLIVRLHTPLSVGELFDKNVSEIIRRLIRIPERKQILKASHLSVPSRAGQILFRKEMGLENKAIRVIANPPPKNLSLKTAVKTNDFEVVYVGRVTRTKGMPILMKAIPLVLDRFPKAKFTLIGGDAGNPEGFEEKVNWLKDMLPENAKTAVDFKGYLAFDEFSSYLEQAAVAVIPSLFDNFPYTCLELMSFAKAIVSSDQGGMVEMLDNGKCGRLFTPPDHQELAKQIIELLQNPELRQELGKLAQERILAEYNKDKIMQETVKYYRQCIDEL